MGAPKLLWKDLIHTDLSVRHILNLQSVTAWPKLLHVKVQEAVTLWQLVLNMLWVVLS